MLPENQSLTQGDSLPPREEDDLSRLALPKQYDVLLKASQGGMGAIYKARNKYTGALVAIKILKIGSSGDEKTLQRFIAEAQAATLLKHPRICQVRDFGLTDANVPYLIMDWIEGIPLGRKIQRDGRMPVQEAIGIFQQVTSALEHAHTNKVVHRDLKPDNVMLTRDDDGQSEVHIVDFGIAKVMSGKERTSEVSSQLTSEGTFVGTPLFMSPEQARANVEIDQRADIYSFGCVMYYVLAGEAPLVGSSAIDTIAKHLKEAPPEFPSRFKIPPDLRAIVFKCLEKNVVDRYQTAAELSADLKKLTKGVGLKHAPLVHEREASRKRMVRIASFIVGFGLMYALSIGVQDLLDTTSTKRSTTTEATRSDTTSSSERKSAHKP